MFEKRGFGAGTICFLLCAEQVVRFWHPAGTLKPLIADLQNRKFCSNIFSF
jgi:hypothetical protein